MLSPNATPQWAGLSLDRPRIMGILNVTPDSFSGAGPRDAAEAGMAMAAAGADIIDVGGESTRPGAAAVPPDIEQERVIPVVRTLAGAGLRVSVDTRNAATMRAALDAGAFIINDVSGLTHDPDALALVASRGCPVVLMHMRGTPDTMNAAAVYGDVVAEVRAELAARIDAALAAGIARDSIAIDPGIGFAKRADHSCAILRGLEAFTSLGYPVLAGVSRKSFIGAITGETRADRRLGGSLAAAVFAALRGAKILRVHDVAETVQAFRVWCSLLD
jgi:dihydropteroate synthase